MSAKKDKENKRRPEEAAEEAVKTEQETMETAGDVENGQENAEQVNSEAEAHKAQLDELNDKLMRTLAEYDNYRKRSQRERLEVYPEAVAATVSKFLPVLDNFERALGADCADPDFKKGVEMIFTSFTECMKALNVEEIEAQGKEFDPNFHNAVMHTEDESVGESVVTMVMQKGYKIGEKVLRHAMVQVAN